MEKKITMEDPTSNCIDFYDDPSYIAVAAVSAGLALLSIPVILMAISIMLLFKKWKYFYNQRLILYLAISAILVNTGIILHRIDYRGQDSEFFRRFCEFGGFLDQYSNWTLLNNVSAVVLYVFFRVYLNKSTEKYDVLYILYIYALPFLISLIPFIGRSYGQAGAWCWIRTQDRNTCRTHELGIGFQFGVWFGPLLINMFVHLILSVMIFVKLYHMKKEWLTAEKQVTKEDLKRIRRDLAILMLYPLIYFIGNILPVINRIYNLVNEEPNLGLWYLTSLVNGSVGLVVVLVFTLDPKTRKRLNVTNIRAAAKEFCQKSSEVVHEYEIEEKKETSVVMTDESKVEQKHPYRNYEHCYHLNLESSRSMGKDS